MLLSVLLAQCLWWSACCASTSPICDCPTTNRPRAPRRGTTAAPLSTTESGSLNRSVCLMVSSPLAHWRISPGTHGGCFVTVANALAALARRTPLRPSALAYNSLLRGAARAEQSRVPAEASSAALETPAVRLDSSIASEREPVGLLRRLRVDPLEQACAARQCRWTARQLHGDSRQALQVPFEAARRACAELPQGRIATCPSRICQRLRALLLLNVAARARKRLQGVETSVYVYAVACGSPVAWPPSHSCNRTCRLSSVTRRARAWSGG